VIDRLGSKPVLVFCAFGISIIPLIWLFPRAGHLWLLIPEDIYSGMLWTGFTLAAFNIPIANSPKESRTRYLAMFSVVTGLGFFVSSLIGGIIAQNLNQVRWQIGNQTIINYHIMFIITAVLRFAAAFLSLSFHEPNEKQVPAMLHYMGYSALKWLAPGRQIAVWFSKAKSELTHYKSDPD
jgi:MFS family permease